jgi:glycosyltransferase involved in cell wall biosynthesis
MGYSRERLRKLMMKKKLNIAVFHLAFIYSGGGEKLVLQQARELVKHGHRVTIFTPVVDKARCFPDWIDEFEIRPILPQFPKWFPKSEALQILMVSLLFPFVAWRFANFDVYLGANQPGPYFCWIIGKIFKKDYVAYLAQPLRLLQQREIDKQTGLFIRNKLNLLPKLVNIFRWFINWTDQRSVRGAKTVLVNGSYAKQMIDAAYRVDSVVCSAASEIGHLKPVSYQKRQNGVIKVNGCRIEKPYILLTNRHFPQKRFEYAISSLAMIKQKLPNVRLVITGEFMPYTDFIRRLVVQLGLEDQVVLTGLIKERALERLYCQAVLYVYTAPEEDFGMGMVEAMAAGTPVVAWRNGGPIGIVEGGKEGLLAEPFEVGDFANKCAEILNDQRLARGMGVAGMKKVRRDFSWQKHLKVLERYLYEAS